MKLSIIYIIISTRILLSELIMDIALGCFLKAILSVIIIIMSLKLASLYVSALCSELNKTLVLLISFHTAGKYWTPYTNHILYMECLI